MTHWWNATARIFRLSWTRRVSALQVWAGLAPTLRSFWRGWVSVISSSWFDVVDITNLNRQHYTMKDLGIPKTLALVEQLEAINPYLTYETYTERVIPSNVERLFSGCDVVVEAFDKPDQKAMLLENLLTRLPEKPVVSGSGMAGYGSANLIKTEKRFGHVYLCGDGTSDVADGLGLMAPRVAVCSAHEGTMVLRLLIGETEP